MWKLLKNTGTVLLKIQSSNSKINQIIQLINRSV
jgi:hypothetical protein